jgi:hypothetical protein
VARGVRTGGAAGSKFASPRAHRRLLVAFSYTDAFWLDPLIERFLGAQALAQATVVGQVHQDGDHGNQTLHGQRVDSKRDIRAALAGTY